MMIRDHLEEEKPPKSTPKNVARVGSGGGLGSLGAPWAGFWTTLKLMRQVKDDLGASKERLGSMLGRFGVVFGPLGRILAPSWAHLGGSWGGGGGILEGSWGKFMDILDTP